MALTSNELNELIKQLQAGLIHELEFLLQVQLHPEVFDRVLAAKKLPYRALVKITIDDLNNDDPRLAPSEFGPMSQQKQ